MSENENKSETNQVRKISIDFNVNAAPPTISQVSEIRNVFLRNIDKFKARIKMNYFLAALNAVAAFLMLSTRDGTGMVLIGLFNIFVVFYLIYESRKGIAAINDESRLLSMLEPFSMEKEVLEAGNVENANEGAEEYIQKVSNYGRSLLNADAMILVKNGPQPLRIIAIEV